MAQFSRSTYRDSPHYSSQIALRLLVGTAIAAAVLLEMTTWYIEQFEPIGPFIGSALSLVAVVLVIAAIVVFARRTGASKTTVVLMLSAAGLLFMEALVHANVDSGIHFLGSGSFMSVYLPRLLELLGLGLLFSGLLFIGIENSAARDILLGHNRDLFLEISRRKKADEALKSIVEGTSLATGHEFFRSLTRHLAVTLNVRTALVTEWADDTHSTLRTLAIWSGDKYEDEILYPIAGTPSESVVEGRQCFYPSDVARNFPKDRTLDELGVTSYLGIPVRGADGEVLGHLSVLDDKPMAHDPQHTWILRVFAERAGAELQRKRAEQERIQLAEIVNHTHDAVTAIDLDGIVTTWNQGAERLYGFSADEVLGSHVANLVPEDAQKETNVIMQRIFSGEEFETFQTLRRHKNGNEIPISLTLSPVRNAKGDISGISGISRDISEQLRQESSLRDSEEKLRSVFENVPDYVLMIDSACRVQYINRVHEGRSAQDLIGIDLFQFVPPEEEQKVRHAFDTVFATGDSTSFEAEAVRDDGSRSTFSCHVGAIERDGEVDGLILVARDVTERKLQDEALEEAEKKYRFLAERMNDIIWTIAADGTYTYTSPSIETVTGFKPSELVGLKVSDVLPPESARITNELLQKALASELEESVFQMELFVKGGGTVWSETNCVVIRNDAGDVVSIQGVTRDITQRKLAESAIKERESQYRRIVETAQEGIWLTDSTFATEFVNDRVAEMLGYEPEEMIGRYGYDFMDAQALSEAQTVLSMHRKGEHHAYEWRLKHKNGDDVRVFVTANSIYDGEGKHVGYLGMLTNITDRVRAEEERKNLEFQIQHGQKLESLGVLAGGIAHDFNNLLAGIMGYAGLAAKGLPAESAARKHLSKIEQAATHAADLTKQMLAYSGKGKFVIENLEIPELLEDLADLLSASVSKKAVLHFDFEDELPQIQGDAGQIKQVLMNLITNASDALSGETGTITVRAGLMHADRSYFLDTYLHEDLSEGEYVFLEVADTGEGMDEETRSRIFDPFFTTKFAGRGLGLAAVLGIVRGHSGAIRVDSEPGKGSTFTLVFPRAEVEIRSTADKEQPAAESYDDWTARGTVLVIDDDDVVRNLACDILEDVGFSVLSACDGEEGLALFEERAGDIDAVLLDLTMPRMSGDEVFLRMQALRPGIRVVLSSGYAESEATEKFDGKFPAAFVQKPYHAQQLVEKIREVLGAETPGTPMSSS